MTASRTLLPPDQYRVLVEHAPTLVWRSGLDARCDYFNGTWLAFTGRSLSEELGDGWTTGVHPDDKEHCVRTYLDHFARRQPFEMEYRLLRRDGIYRYLFDRGVPFSDERGQFAGFIGSCVDVHERHEAEAAKTQFLAMTAHELRTPVQSIALYVEGLRRKVAAGQPVKDEMFVRLQRQIARFTALARDLAEVARLEQGQGMTLDFEAMDLAELVRETCVFHEEALALSPKSIHTIHVRVAPGVYRIRGDRIRLGQVLSNLLDNALKYSPEGGTIEVDVFDDKDGARVVSVKDPGIGIPAGEVAMVTRRYFRASNAPQMKFAGMGLGLSLSREIIERHGGLLEIRSDLGKGTIVSLVLPPGEIS